MVFHFGTYISVIAPILVVLIVGYMIISLINSRRKKNMPQEVRSNNLSSAYIHLGGKRFKRRTINKILFAIGSLPLSLYLGVLVANIMALAAIAYADNLLEVIGTFLFVIFTGSYGVTYLIGLVCYPKYKDKTIMISLVPIIHELALVLFIALI